MFLGVVVTQFWCKMLPNMGRPEQCYERTVIPETEDQLELGVNPLAPFDTSFAPKQFPGNARSRSHVLAQCFSTFIVLLTSS